MALELSLQVDDDDCAATGRVVGFLVGRGTGARSELTGGVRGDPACGLLQLEGGFEEYLQTCWLIQESPPEIREYTPGYPA